MYSRKGAEPRAEPWGTLILTWCSCEDFQSITTRIHLLLRKEEVRPNIWPKIPQDLTLWKRPVCQTLSKALDTICSWSKRHKAILEISKKGYISSGDQQFCYLKFSQRLCHRNKNNRAIGFSCRHFPHIFKYMARRRGFPTLWKTRLLQEFIEELS